MRLKEFGVQFTPSNLGLALDKQGVKKYVISNLRGLQCWKSIEMIVKVLASLEHSCAILSSFKIVIIFNVTSAEIKTKSADA